MKLTFDDNPTKDEIKIFHDGLVKYNNAFVLDDFERYFIVAKSDTGDVVGGIEFETYWGRSYIHNLWVEDGYRKNGLGTELLRRIETIVKSKYCRGIEVSTMTFQAKEFYEKNGFKCVGKFENFVNEYECLFFSKEI